MARPHGPKDASNSGLRPKRHGATACDGLDYPGGQNLSIPAVPLVGEVDGAVFRHGNPSRAVDFGADGQTTVPREPALAGTCYHLELARGQMTENLASPAIDNQQVPVWSDR